MTNRPIFFSASGYKKPTELAKKIGEAAGFTDQEIDALTQLLKPAVEFTATEQNIAYLKAGLVEAEEFRSGNSSAPGSGFTGVRIGRAGFTYNAEDGWLLASVENDVLEVGINSTDGKLYFGGGAGWLDADGIFIKNNQSSIFSFGDSVDTRGYLNIWGGLSNEFVFENIIPGGNAGLKFSILLASGGNKKHMFLREDPANADKLQLDLALAPQGSKFTLGGEVEIHGVGASGGETKMLLRGIMHGGIDAPQGFLINGKIVPSVAANDLTVAIKTLAGVNPSAADPVFVRIGDTVRTITAALSVTKNDGTNWFNAGEAELATKEIDYFVYLGYNATDGVVIGFARIPYAKKYSDFSATTTNERYAAISTITTANAADYYENVGRFAAILSAGAGYTWTVPAFTALNLVNRPIYETSWLTFVPQWTGYTTGNGNNTGRYRLRDETLTSSVRVTLGSTSAITGSVSYFEPMISATFGFPMVTAIFEDPGVAYYLGLADLNAATGKVTLYYVNAAGAAAVLAAISATLPFVWAPGDNLHVNHQYNLI